MTLGGEGPVDLPDDQEFFEAVSDCSNVVISAAGGRLSAYSGILQQESPVFREKLSKFLAGTQDTDFSERDGKVVLNLDCSYDTAQALFAFITSKGVQALSDSASPAMLRELAAVAHEWQVEPLLKMVDSALACQMRTDMAAFRKSTAKAWQYTGTHIRERGVQMLKLALMAELKEVQAEAEMFVAANWQLLSEDDRLTKELDIDSLCRIHRLAALIQQASTKDEPPHPRQGSRSSMRQFWCQGRKYHHSTAKAK